MDTELLGSTLDLVGKLMVAYTALAVHGRVRRERRIDAAVFRSMRREQYIGVVGIAFMVIGYLLRFA